MVKDKNESTFIGNDIKSIRVENKLSQEELSKKSGVDRAQLSRIETGEVLGVTYSTVEKILSALNKKITFEDIEKKDISCEAKPFVKWAGGKTQLLNTIENYLPKRFNTYFEPFVGGGAVLYKLNPNKAYINDANEELICAYNCFQNDESFFKLIQLLKKHEEYNSEEYYYEVRNKDTEEDFNSSPIEVRAARMIYLNKACFNGLYRVNSKGYFNVPFGKKEIVKCFDINNFNNLRNFFSNNDIHITNTDFESACKNAKKGDFVYFDPPYDTWEDKSSFTSYNKNSFGKDEQIRLSNLYKKLDSKGVMVMLSNHNTEFIRELYKDFNIHVIPAKRMINSKASERGNVEEVLITNYE